jgi:hypothetical protein
LAEFLHLHAGMLMKSKYLFRVLLFPALLYYFQPLHAQNDDFKSRSEAAIMLEKAFRQQEKGNLTKAMEIAAQAAKKAGAEIQTGSASDTVNIRGAKRVIAESYILISKGIEASGADRKGGLLDSNLTWLSARIKQFRSDRNYPVFAGDLYFTLAEKYLLWSPDFLTKFSQKQASDSASRYLVLAWKDYIAFNQTGSDAYGKLLNDLSKLAYKNRNYQAAEDYALEWILWMEQSGKAPNPASKIWLAQCEFFNQHPDLAFKHINEGLNLSVVQKDPISYAEGTRAYACMAYAERGSSEAAVVYGILAPGLDAAKNDEGESILNARLMMIAGITDLAEIDPVLIDSLNDISEQLSKSILPDLALLSSPWPEFYFRLDQCRLSLIKGDWVAASAKLSDMEKRLEFLAPQYPEVSTHELKSEMMLLKASVLIQENKKEAALKVLQDYKSRKKLYPSYDKIDPDSMLNDPTLIREELVNHFNLLCK